MPQRKDHEEPTPAQFRRQARFSLWELLVFDESDFDPTDYDGKYKCGSDQGGEGNISGGKARNSHEGKRTNGSDPGGEGNIGGRKGRSRSPGRAVRMLTSSESEASSESRNLCPQRARN